MISRKLEEMPNLYCNIHGRSLSFHAFSETLLHVCFFKLSIFPQI